MPVKNLFSFLAALLISNALLANGLDSLGVENVGGKQFIVHKVEAKETYFSLGRRYGTNPAAIIDYNKNKALTIGTLVRVPTHRPFVAGTPAPVLPAITEAQETWITYTVKPKETLYSVSKKFNTTIEELKANNTIRNNSLAIGQKLRIRIGKPNSTPVVARIDSTAVAEPVVPETATPAAESTTEEDRKLPASRYGLREVKERGIATWIQDESLDDSKMIALHPSAPIGTIIKVTNPMTQKSTFAKVVGKFTENEANKGVIIILTKPAADLIGALDKRFQVNLVYGVPDDQQ